jgi:hypothetical protein
MTRVPPTQWDRSVTRKCWLAVVLGCFLVGSGSWGQEVIEQRETGKVQALEKVDGESGSSAVPVWTEEQTPVDFLEAVGLVAKARWRQLYRPPPTTPSPDRTRTAVTLGFLVGESYLCVQAADAQQFRNNNQEVMTYCRTLGFGEKVSPMLLGQAKLAEMEQWTELKVSVIEGYQALEQSLMDQRDEDLAVLLKLGVWLRTLEIVSSVVLESPEADFKKLCVGSPALIEELRGAYVQMPESVREGDVGKEVGLLLDFLWRNWGRPDLVEPNSDVVQKTHERLVQSARKLSLK